MHNDPVGHVDLWGLTASDIAAGESVLQGAAKRADRLQDLINTDNLAKILSSNINSFDPATKAYYAAMPESVRTTAIREQLNKTVVYSGIDASVEQQVFDNFGATTGVKDGLTIGNSIYVLEEITYMDEPTAEFLGHETIHIVTTSVVGIVNFTVYNATAPYDESNEYEKAGYSFGGYADSNFPNIDNSNQILDRNKDWWK